MTGPSPRPTTSPDEGRGRVRLPPLDCIELVELVTEYLEGELNPADCARLEAHLAECDGCSAYIEQMRATIRAAGHLPAEAIAPSALEHVLRAYREFRGSS
ncbi:MAG TPA: zf-HC2 domain-containing protein [Candidatus Limnocylindrales bacterium]